MKTEHTIDCEFVLCELGVRNVRAVGNEVNYSCPDPSHTHGDHRPSAYMRQSWPYPYICFGCGRKGTVVDFVADWLGIENPAAWRWLGEKFGFESAYDPRDTITETLNRILGPKSVPEIQVRDNYVVQEPKDMFNLLEVDIGKKYLNDRGLDDDTIRAWNLKWDAKSGRVTIPIHNRAGDLIGYKARSIDGKEPKYLVLGDRKEKHYGFIPYNSSTILFGLNRVPLHTRSLVVCEGELDAIACWQAGIQNVVGLPTAGMSDYQAAIIREGFDTVTLFLDSDAAGQKGLNSACRLLAGACVLRLVDEHEEDPMGMEREEIRRLIEEAKHPLLTQLQQIGVTTWQV